MASIVDSTPLVHWYSKEKLDDVANEFLREYCPEVLKQPMAVPIMDIAMKKMGLRVYTKYRLSEDFSILGQMCFTSGLVTIYDKDEDEYRDIKVRRGTMLIDPDTYLKRNTGCFNNTVAHECFHWYKHRNYHLYGKAVGKDNTTALRCPVEEKNVNYHDDWDDEDWMEWQANNAAPRILMPKVTFICAANEVIKQGHETYGPSLQAWWVTAKLAELYDVSKQSARIRLDELGISID
ncbi:MAG: ImmA/IrrE family metallo-endopeptidase [Clostridia bacterium]|nr:ImmA/IrrE family metallo-endopeptidase [Clostridia bacterium]